MSTAAQRRAIKNYRERLARRGIERIEAAALETDRSLIRALGGKLVEDGPKAERLRAAVKALIADEAPRCAAVFLPHSVARHWSGRISICHGRVSRDAGSTFDTQLSRHNIIGNQLRIRAAGWPINSKMTVCTSMDIAEIQRGILEPSGGWRRALESWFAGGDGPQALFAGRILSFDDQQA